MNPSPFVKNAVRCAAIPLARTVTRRWPRILMYHRFGPGNPERKVSGHVLERQLSYLRRHFTFVPLSTLVARLRAGDEFDRNWLAVTVDDAYADFKEYAYPLFCRFGVPVTLYVISDFADGRSWLWWDAIQYCLRTASAGRHELAFNGQALTLVLSDDRSREEAWRTCAACAGSLGPEERDELIFEIQRALCVSLPSVPPSEFSALSWEGLRSLDSGLIEIGAHTRTHPILATCDPERIRDEVVGSKRAIEARIGRPVRSFCYPNGEWPFLDMRVVDCVKEAGFDSGVMACGDVVRPGADPLLLPRMSASREFAAFRGDVAGVAYLRQLLQQRLVSSQPRLSERWSPTSR